ncbi:MAG: amidase [Geminicoccaceae bacterium]|nr:amidase [Geminicoccaceae bacterium]
MRFDEYRRHDALGLAGLVRRGEVTAGELLDLAVARLDAVDGALGIVGVREEAAARARLDAGPPDGAFRGVPYLFKDLFAFEAGRPLTNGSRLFEGFVAPSTSTYIARTLAAGLVPFAKSRAPELGLNLATEPRLHGPTRNPWDRGRSAGGSSGGAAAAVAAGVVPMAHATDGGGSIRVPAAACGLFGLKPSRGRNPMGPFIGEAWNGLACPHCVARSVRDGAALLDATAGPEPGDPYACPPPERPFLAELGRDPPPLRVALVAERPGGGVVHPDAEAAVEGAGALLEDLGHRVEPWTLPFAADELETVLLDIITSNLAADLGFWAGVLKRPLDASTLEACTLALLRRGRDLPAVRLQAAIGRMHGMGRALGNAFQTFDVILQPTLALPPPPIGWLDQDGDPDAFAARSREFCPFTALYNMTGLPAASLPLYWNGAGLPIGVMAAAALGKEGLLFSLAGQLERARPWFDRVPAG